MRLLTGKYCPQASPVPARLKNPSCPVVQPARKQRSVTLPSVRSLHATMRKHLSVALHCAICFGSTLHLSLIHISEPTRRTPISYAVFCLKKKKNRHK